MKKYWKSGWFCGGIALLIAGSAVLVWWTGGGGDPSAGQAETTVIAATGDLDAAATASGRVEARRQAGLAFQQGGTVAEVLVEAGMPVQAGDPLVRLDSTDLQRAVLEAEQALLIQEQQLANLTAPPSAAELAVAEANVASAQARLDSLQSGPTAAEIAASEATLRASEADVTAAAARLESAQSGGTAEDRLGAEFALEAAQTAYTRAEEAHRASYDCTWNDQTGAFDCVGGSDREKAARVTASQAYADLVAAQERLANLQPGAAAEAIASAQASLTSAVARRDAARARHDLLLAGGSEADRAAAAAALARAQAQLETLREGPAATQIARQEALVEQAHVAVARANLALEKSVLAAPFRGVVTAVNTSPGEMTSGLVVELIDMDSLEVVLDVDEVDIGEIAIGQPAGVTLPGWPGTTLDGAVVAIAPENEANSAGTVVYQVRLSLPAGALPLREGMTADARLVTARREGVLLLPNAAIKADRANGTFSVDVVSGREANGTLIVTETPITIGLRDGEFTQITAGITAGTEVAIGYNPPPRRQFGPGPGGPPPGG